MILTIVQGDVPYEQPSRLSVNETENIYIPCGFNTNSLRIPNRTYTIMASGGNFSILPTSAVVKSAGLI